MKLLRNLLFGVFLVAGLQCQASTIYNDRALWLAATQNVITLNFEGLADSESFADYTSGGLTLSGVTFTANGSLYVIAADYDPVYNWNSGAILDAQDGTPTTILATLPGGITAFGFDFMSPLAIAPPDFLVELSNGETFTVSSGANPNRTFVGFTSAVPISFVNITPQSSGVDSAIDNFSFGLATPEPGYFGLAAALSLLMVTRSKSSKATAFPHQQK